MFKSLFCNLHEVSYKIWKDKPISKGDILALMHVVLWRQNKTKHTLNPTLIAQKYLKRIFLMKRDIICLSPSDGDVNTERAKISI